MGLSRHSDRFAGGFDALYGATAAQVLAYAMRRASPTDAEDAAAATFEIAWRKLSDAPAEPLPWLYAICRRVLANQHRSSNRFAALWERIARGESTTRNLRMEGGPATNALAALREDDRELLRLVAWEGLDHDAIALVLGITANAVAIRLHRARARFSAELGQQSSASLKDMSPGRTSTPVTGTPDGRETEDAG